MAGAGAAGLATQTSRAPALRPPPSARRWRLPVVLATGVALLAHAPSFCASPLLQHGWALLRTAACVLLPLLAPAFVDLMPPGGAAALAARAPPASAAGAAQCAANQGAAVALATAALAWQLCRAERRARKPVGAASTPQ